MKLDEAKKVLKNNGYKLIKESTYNHYFLILS